MMKSRLCTMAGLVSALSCALLPTWGCGDGGNEGATSIGTGGSGSTVEGAGGWSNAGEGEGGDSSQCERSVAVFNPDTILEYHITMDPALYEDMKANGKDEVYRRAALQVRGGEVAVDYDAIGLRYKGDYSLNHCWDNAQGTRSYAGECAKLSVKLKFNEYDEEGRLFGLKRLNLNAMSYDDTKLAERLAYSLFNDFGVGTARTAHAKLYINDEAPLLVIAVEAIDGRYTACKYPEAGDGDLFKEVWPRPSMSESVLRESLRTNDAPEDSPDLAAFIDFGNAVGAATEATFVDAMASFVDLEQLLRYMAVDRAIKNWDGITAFYWPERPHNYYWYHDDGAQSIFHLIPWDLDQTLWEYDPYMELEQLYAERQVPDWNVRPLSCEPIDVWDSEGEVTVIPAGCDYLINLLAATKWDEFAAIGTELLGSVLRYDVMDEKVTAWANQIASAVDEDPVISKGAWEARVEDLRRNLQKAIGDFEAHLREGYIVEQ